MFTNFFYRNEKVNYPLVINQKPLVTDERG